MSQKTERVVATGNYQHVNHRINSEYFPWRRLCGKNTIELVDMTQHGFSSNYSLNDALAVLTRLGLGRPIYEDALLFGKSYPKIEWHPAIIFPHKPVLDSFGCPVIISLWGNSASGRGLYLHGTNSSCGWDPKIRVAGVRES